jgi:pyruvate dehydrogenase E2 component (dihydrolipoamide acetyltransferase)
MPKVMSLPKLGVNMEKAKIVAWIADVGQAVAVDQPLLEAETDKALVEIPSTVAGVLAKRMAEAGDTVKCGEPLAVFVDPGESLPAEFRPAAEAAARVGAASAPDAGRPQPVAAEVASLPAARPAPSAGVGRVRISPLARRTARELNLDVTRMSPSRPGARITRADVLAHRNKAGARAAFDALGPSAASMEPPVDPSLTVKGTIPIEGIRGLIAERMRQSTRSTARAVLFAKVDMSSLNRWREDLKTQGNPVSVNSLVVAVVGRALAEHPAFNARIAGAEIQLLEEINVGVAVDTARGLIVPTIRQADKKGVVAIDRDFKEKVERAKAGKASLADVSGGTFTVTNLGMFGVEAFVPIINPPEAAILAMGATAKEQVVMEDESVAIRPMCRLSLVWDHRINDGAPAGRFLARIKQLMEWPLGLVS